MQLVPAILDLRNPDLTNSGVSASSYIADTSMEDAALIEMIERHSRFVYRIAYSVVRNPADAEDITQETFLQVIHQKTEIREQRSYLARIAWRLAVRRKSHTAPEKLSPDSPSSKNSPESDAIENQTQAWLHAQIDALPEKLRQPLALTALGELRSPEIAAILSIPEGTVRHRIHTARQLLRKQWEKRTGVRP
jgi:RNA polymerase sigma-70 factor (ECF subfamily)